MAIVSYLARMPMHGPLPVNATLYVPAAPRKPGTNDRPRAVVQQFIEGWTIATTCEESRTHLDLEIRRQWSVRAIERTTPCSFGLYSMVTLPAHALHPDGKVLVQRAAWNAKPHATLTDALAAVRHHVGREFN
jgi:hypothetical protein